MVLNLFKMLNIKLPFPIWVFTVLAIVFWWFFTRGLASLLIKSRVRTASVIHQTQMVVFLVGAIFVFNTTLVPIVLVSFNGMAFHALWICGVSAILYFLRVDKKPERNSDFETGYSKYKSNNDPFA